MTGAMSGTLGRPKSLQPLNLPSPTGKKGGGTNTSTTTITITKDNPLAGHRADKDRKVCVVFYNSVGLFLLRYTTNVAIV